MSDNKNSAPIYEEGALKIEKMTSSEVIFAVVGCGIGSGALGTAYSARLGGFPVIAFWLIVSGILTLISMYYVAEATLRTRKMIQLPGLADRYVGGIGKILVFLAVVINSLSCLIAYFNGSGEIIADFLGVSKGMGAIIFMVPAALVTYLGLKAIGVAGKYMSIFMIGLILILTGASFLASSSDFGRLFIADWKYAIPIFNVAAFSYIGQYLVPDLARGLAHEPKKLAPSLLIGQIIVAILLILIPMGTFIVAPADEITQVATLVWGRAIGQWAFFGANIFALVAMFTSFTPVTQTLISNIVDFFKLRSDSDPKIRIPIMVIVLAIPLYLTISGKVSFIDAVYFSGTFAAAIMAILPIFMVNNARKTGDIEPEWTCGKLASWPVQAVIIVMYGGTIIYAILGALGYLPAGW
ncbi:aromatic amino acid transport family protein [Anaerosphaera multitolerans]|uniref:Amino acid permease n=1 Tax=Anaerosphaera multitolerans TaxID=2487351 RepID=A0A437S4E2_9FIRM|nr:aromatic amino acid transport family protein [Anaerosphaera multitolerans]RVU53902.1 amino acid permease [Anaerosphaera multitolerans]